MPFRCIIHNALVKLQLVRLQLASEGGHCATESKRHQLEFIKAVKQCESLILSIYSFELFASKLILRLV